MADDTSPQAPPSDTLDDDLKSDWESAFQAEDFMFAPQEGEDDFFLGDDTDFNSATSSPYEFTPPTETELANLPDLDEENAAPAARGAAPSKKAVRTAAAPGLKGAFGRAAPLLRAAALFLQRFSRRQQIIGATAAVLLAAILFFLRPAPHHPASTVATAPTAAPAAPATPGAPPAQTASAGKATTAAAPPAKAPPEKVRVKWPFPAFLIPAPSPPGTSQPASFVHVDITLVLLLPKDEDPPKEKELQLRDSIYQFFSNQPAAELRRYGLARGEMNHKLRAWLYKQWPDAPIETIVFTRYSFS